MDFRRNRFESSNNYLASFFARTTVTVLSLFPNDTVKGNADSGCGAEDTVEHVPFDCPHTEAWKNGRTKTSDLRWPTNEGNIGKVQDWVVPKRAGKTGSPQRLLLKCTYVGVLGFRIAAHSAMRIGRSQLRLSLASMMQSLASRGRLWVVLGGIDVSS
ncbi:hypothetical protein Trydic_g913 [Trypoxylus dichotomus]